MYFYMYNAYLLMYMYVICTQCHAHIDMFVSIVCPASDLIVPILLVSCQMACVPCTVIAGQILNLYIGCSQSYTVKSGQSDRSIQPTPLALLNLLCQLYSSSASSIQPTLLALLNLLSQLYSSSASSTEPPLLALPNLLCQLY